MIEEEAQIVSKALHSCSFLSEMFCCLDINGYFSPTCPNTPKADSKT